jgi:hypothetical protein
MIIAVNQLLKYVGFEVLSAVVMKRCIFWLIAPYTSLKIHLLFGRTCLLLLHGPKMSQARNQHGQFPPVSYTNPNLPQVD